MNINHIGGLLDHSNAVYDGVQVIVRSEHVHFLRDEGRLLGHYPHCKYNGGISIQPNQGFNQSTTVKNSVFSGFNRTCTGGRNAAIHFDNEQVFDGVFNTMPRLLNNTFEANDERITACMSIHHSFDSKPVRCVAVEDQDGSMSGTGQSGFYIQDDSPVITNLIDEASCHEAYGCLRFCPGVCLRLGVVYVSFDITTVGFKMHIQDGDKSAAVDRGWKRRNGAWLNAPIPFVLPAPTSGKYSITFTDRNGDPAWPGYVKEVKLDESPACGGFDLSHLSFDMPPPDGRCDELFHLDNYTGTEIIHGWRHHYSGIRTEAGSPVVSTTMRHKNNYGPRIDRPLDPSCFAGLGGRKYTLSGKIRITDANGAYVETDGLSNHSPRLTLNVDGVKKYSWNIPTNGDGTWHEFTKTLTLPVDSSAASKAILTINEAWKNEFHIKDFGMVLEPPEPSASPSNSGAPTISQAPTFEKPVYLGCWADHWRSLPSNDNKNYVGIRSILHT